MTELTKYFKEMEDYSKYASDVNKVLSRLKDYPLVETKGNEDKKIDFSDIIDFTKETFAQLTDTQQKEKIEESIENLTENVTDETSLSTNVNYGNLWTFLLKELENSNFVVSEDEEVFTTQLEDYLIAPKFSYYDENDCFSTKREAIRSYERIIYETNSDFDPVYQSKIYKEINDALFTVTPPDQYISEAIPLRYNYLRILENSYTIFNDQRDTLIRATFNNRINYIDTNEAYNLVKILAKRVVYIAREKHNEYIEELKSEINDAMSELGGAFIDFSKLFDDVAGNYLSQIGAASGRLYQLTSELVKNYNFDLDSEHNSVTTIIEEVLTECTNIVKDEGVTNISTLEDIRNYEFIFLLSKFFNKDTSTYPSIEALLLDAKNFRKKEAHFIKCLLSSNDKNKYQYTENFLKLYKIVKLDRN